ncbi:hypothetical protein LUZ63_005445 [Rhynchospora breviuscula]|uniref:Uncharacterized protein n=1 Tax=Rhynchospora breviuscula TaxID=2022672 RepID=A0A9Q0CN96_9POAL|nr:hypothetical protein LUZ63_005445 [Rhynchospora breviuscula]
MKERLLSTEMAASSPLSMPLSPMAVVGLQFCTSDNMVLTITKKFSFSGGYFVISDANGTILMKVHGRPFSLCRVLCDAAGTPIISMRNKQRFSMHQRWNVYRGDSKNQRDLLFTVKKTHIFQFNTELGVFLAGNTAEQHCDFKIEESWLGRSCTFYLGDSNIIIAQMSRQFEIRDVLLGRDTYRVTVYPNVDYAFIVAIIVIIDELHRSSGSNSSS